MKKSISVVIPNYNGAKLLQQNLPSVFDALTRYGGDFEVIIPDDCSTDDSINFLKQSHPKVIVIKGDKNLGFSGNINRGLRLANKDLVLALNSDVSLTPNFFEYLVGHFDDPDLFGVVGLMKDPTTKQNLVAAKYCRKSPFGEMDATKNLIKDETTPLPTFYLSGAAALMDLNKLKSLDYFNEIYSPFYREDTDLGLMAWRMGWTCLFDPRAIGYHETSSTINSYNKRKYIKFIGRRNKFIFHYLHLEGTGRLMFFIKTAFDLLTRWITFDTTYYLAFIDFMKKLGAANKVLVARKPVYTTQYVFEKLEHEQNINSAIRF